MPGLPKLPSQSAAATPNSPRRPKGTTVPAGRTKGGKQRRGCESLRDGVKLQANSVFFRKRRARHRYPFADVRKTVTYDPRSVAEDRRTEKAPSWEENLGTYARFAEVPVAVCRSDSAFAPASKKARRSQRVTRNEQNGDGAAKAYAKVSNSRRISCFSRGDARGAGIRSQMLKNGYL